MEKRMVLVFTSLLTLLLASFALNPSFGDIPTTPPGSETHRYIVMGGEINASTQLGPWDPTFWVTPYQTRPPYLMPLLGEFNITFSDRDPVTGIVNLTIPRETWVSFVNHAWFDTTSGFWFRLWTFLESDGYGWLFTGDGTAPVLGDVDIITFNNDTGVYFFGPDGLAGTADDSNASLIESAGPDNIPGTDEDDFGDGTPDPAGSSILYIPGTLHVDYWEVKTGTWQLLFESPWPMLMTTATAYDVVIEPASDINRANSTDTGQPWEFLAGIEHPPAVPHGHPKWNAYVTYVCAWSVLNHWTDLEYLDVMFQVVLNIVREDLMIADINGDEVCNIIDIVIAALAFDARDESPGGDGTPGTPDDMPVADPNYDARGDLRPDRGLVNIVDIVRIALDFDEKLFPP